MTQLIQPQAQDHHMLPRPNLGKNLYHHRQRGYVIYYEHETERWALCMSSPRLDGGRGGDARVGAA